MAKNIQLDLDDAQESAATWKAAQFNAIKTRDNQDWQPITVEQFVRMHAAQLARAWRMEQIDDEARGVAEAQKKAEGLY